MAALKRTYKPRIGSSAGYIYTCILGVQNIHKTVTLPREKNFQKRFIKTSLDTLKTIKTVIL